MKVHYLIQDTLVMGLKDELLAGRYLLYIENNIIAVPGVYRIIMESEGFYSKGDVWRKGSEN